ncbi:MAG TPA: hypothetical protein VH413_15980 [Verrucomicrobiae bacterium]|nr:hypothetical protein [Verrucomicrobiae bacterium]
MSEATLIRLAVIEFLDRQEQGYSSQTLLLNQSSSLSEKVERLTPPVNETVSYRSSKSKPKSFHKNRRPIPAPSRSSEKDIDRKALEIIKRRQHSTGEPSPNTEPEK